MEQVNPGFEPGFLPRSHLEHVIPGVEDLQGTWEEFEKQEAELSKILERLGIGAIKRRMVVRTNNRFEIERRWPPVTDFTKDQGAVEKSPRSETEATTEPSSPVRRSDYQTRWYQKQMFPMGRFAEAEIVTNFGRDVEHTDKETGVWMCSATVIDNALIQKRVSEALGVTTFESRALVNRRFTPEDGTPGLRYLDTKDYNDKSLMFFQWVLIDHRNNDNKLSCTFCLKRV